MKTIFLKLRFLKFSILILVLTLALGTPLTAQAKAVQFNILKSTPVGSSQTREEINTNHKGKQTGTVFKTSLVDKEIRNGQPHYWIEMRMQTFKISKKGKRKNTGKPAIMKSLVAESTFTSDPANIMNNLSGFAVETIMQNGNSKPIRMNNTGGFMAGMMKASQANIQFDFTELGNETVTVPAGEFASRKIQGKGTTEVNLVIKKMRIESDTTAWMSSKVPFGTVKVAGTSLTNGKSSTFHSELMAYSMSGAVSEITQVPDEMPSFGGSGNIFGQQT